MIYSDTIVPIESILTLIIDNDPLLELYYDEKRKIGWDTAVINDIISRGELEEYFKRLK